MLQSTILGGFWVNDIWVYTLVKDSYSNLYRERNLIVFNMYLKYIVPYILKIYVSLYQTCNVSLY